MYTKYRKVLLDLIDYTTYHTIITQPRQEAQVFGEPAAPVACSPYSQEAKVGHDSRYTGERGAVLVPQPKMLFRPRLALPRRSVRSSLPWLENFTVSPTACLRS